MYEKLYGLSCVENHVLSILRANNEQIEYTYYNCAVPLNILYQTMVIEGIHQENFNTLERIQNALKKLGIINIIKMNPMVFDEVLRGLNNKKENEFFLLRVVPSFTKNKLNARGLRDDHFVYVEPCGDGYQVINDIPEKRIVLTAEQLEEYFDGEYFKLSIKRKLNEDDINKLWDMREYKPENFIRFNIVADDLYKIDNVGKRLRDLTGVYKLLRYRMADYYGKYLDTTFISENMEKIEKIYSMFEYYNLKPYIPVEKYESLFIKLYELDAYLLMRLRREMELKRC